MRHPDWVVRLAALLRAAERRAFDARRWNCALFALAAVEAVTGQWPAVRVLPDLAASADGAGFPRVAPLLARMGDIVLAPDPDRLGVVLDAGRAAFVGPRGLVRAPLTLCTIAWRIGCAARCTRSRRTRSPPHPAWSGRRRRASSRACRGTSPSARLPPRSKAAANRAAAGPAGASSFGCAPAGSWRSCGCPGRTETA